MSEPDPGTRADPDEGPGPGLGSLGASHDGRDAAFRVDDRPRHDRPSVTVLIPAKNEEEGIRQTLSAIPRAALKSRGYDAEILVVDGRSDDRTREYARTHGARIIVQNGRGKGDAVRHALKEARGDIIVMLDGDDTYPADAIPDFVDAVANGLCDVALGSRLRGVREPGAMRGLNLVGNVALSTIGATLYGRGITDVCTGMWAFRREDAARASLTSNGFDLEAELFAKFSKLGLQFVEYPITYRARAGPTKLSRFRDGFRIAGRLFRERWTDLPPDGAVERPKGRVVRRDAPPRRASTGKGGL